MQRERKTATERALRGLVLFSVALVLPAGVATTAHGQTALGEQRIATSSGTFLKIGLDARGASLAGTYNTLASGAVATFFNPAGILGQGETPQAHFSYVQWPADIHIGSVAFTRPFDPLDAQISVGFAYLGTEFEETTEFQPLGTDRTLSYSDFLASFSFARRFTDRLSIGLTAKYLREDLGSNLGGPTTSGVLFDAGTMYELGYRNSRLAITLLHFGPDLEPTGSYQSAVSGSDVSYSAFSPPTMFQLGFSIDAWNDGPHRLITAGQVVHPADQNETVQAGAEYWFQDAYAIRGGYDFAADEFGFSAGLGWRLRVGERQGAVDYAFTEGGNLSAIHRWSVGISL